MGRAYSWPSLVAIGLISTIASGQQTNADLEAVATGNMAFGTDLYDILRKSSKDNLIVSPIFVATVMAMLQAGARGNSAEVIRETMKFPESQQLNNGFKALLPQLLKINSTYPPEMATRIYPADGFNLNPEFVNTLKTYYTTDPQQLNYRDPQKAANTITDFVSTSTHERIQDVIGPSDLNDLTRLVLVNAIGFKGFWAQRFDESLTSKANFYVSQNETIKVDTMRRLSKLDYKERTDLDAKVVVLPFEDRLSMLIVLPNKRAGLAELEDKLKNIPIQDLTKNLYNFDVNLSLPKFKLESSVDLKEPLTALGAGDIFTDIANLSGISEDGKTKLLVSKAIHKTFIEVNEEGNEAAAATGVMMSSMFLSPPSPPARFEANHPFYFAVLTNFGKNDSKTPLVFG